MYYFSKRKGKYFYTFKHFYKKGKKSKIAQIYYYEPKSAGINVQSPQSESTPRRLTLSSPQQEKKIQAWGWLQLHKTIHIIIPQNLVIPLIVRRGSWGREVHPAHFEVDI